MELKEKELLALREIKPEYEKAKTMIATLENELNGLRENIAELTKEKEALKAEIELEKEEKNEVHMSMFELVSSSTC